MHVTWQTCVHSTKRSCRRWSKNWTQAATYSKGLHSSVWKRHMMSYRAGPSGYRISYTKLKGNHDNSLNPSSYTLYQAQKWMLVSCWSHILLYKKLIFAPFQILLPCMCSWFYWLLSFYRPTYLRQSIYISYSGQTGCGYELYYRRLIFAPFQILLCVYGFTVCYVWL